MTEYFSESVPHLRELVASRVPNRLFHHVVTMTARPTNAAEPGTVDPPMAAGISLLSLSR